MHFADLDCITLDAFGTLLALEDPVPSLESGLLEHGVARSREEIANAFKVEIEWYRERMLEGRDDDSLARLRRECCGVFLDSLAVELESDEFLPDFVGSLRFRAERGAIETVRLFRSRGLALAVISNWDCSLEQRLAEVGLVGFFDCVVSSASVGLAKPDPRIFHYALEHLSVAAERSLHIGDSEEDRAGAVSAGMGFAWAPLESALKELSE